MAHCLKYQTLLIRFFDTQLTAEDHLSLETHLQECPDCTLQKKKNALLTQYLQEQPLKKMPFRMHEMAKEWFPFFTHFLYFIYFPWKSLPGYIRMLFDVFSLLTGMCLLISFFPQWHDSYKKWVHIHSLSSVEEFLNFLPHTEQIEENTSHLVSLEEKKKSFSSSHSLPALSSHSEKDHFLKQSRSSSYQGNLWRFSFKTVSPMDLQTSIMHILSQVDMTLLNNPAQPLIVPGGIEFDFLIPEQEVSLLKDQLEKLSHSESEKLSWYRVKSKKKIPEGMSQIIIWLSQIH